MLHHTIAKSCNAVKTVLTIQFMLPGVMVPQSKPNIHEEMIRMNEPHKTVEVEHKDIQQKSDSSMVAATFIKYAAYVLIFFGFLYFLVKYVFPKF
ncbi:hypothetical protein [Paenibacillus tundrae]|nr:hypothetical protein [Paenibacillus tundrae]